MRKHTFIVTTFVATIFIATCAEAQALKVGVTAGPHAMIMDKVKEMAKKKGMDIQVVEFNDFILPNVALDQGDLDVNSMQHQPFLDDQVKSKSLKIVSLGKSVLMPMGIYSKTCKKIDDIKDNAKIGIPNDPTNGGRALLLLEKAGLIKLKKIDLPSVLDITENPKKLVIKEVDAPQLPRSLEDLDAAVINTDWVVLAKIDPKTALLTEGKDSPYTNVLVVRQSHKDDKDIQDFLKLYQSKEVRDYIVKEFKGAVVPAF